MHRLIARGALAGAFAFSAVSAAIAAHDTPLTKVAADLGYAYSYLGPEDAVSLERPGVTIVIRPGERLFDVNDRTEAMDGPPPRFYHDDVFVSDLMVARLRQIARRYPSGSGAGPAPAPAIDRIGTNGGAISGTISGLTVSQIAGRQEIAVTGKAPPNLPITLTLVGTFTSEIPDVVLTRHGVTSEADGTFKTTLTIASGYFRGSVLTLNASSVPGISPAKAQLVMKPPNGTTSIPADEVPQSIR